MSLLHLRRTCFSSRLRSIGLLITALILWSHPAFAPQQPLLRILKKGTSQLVGQPKVDSIEIVEETGSRLIMDVSYSDLGIALQVLLTVEPFTESGTLPAGFRCQRIQVTEKQGTVRLTIDFGGTSAFPSVKTQKLRASFIRVLAKKSISQLFDYTKTWSAASAATESTSQVIVKEKPAGVGGAGQKAPDIVIEPIPLFGAREIMNPVFKPVIIRKPVYPTASVSASKKEEIVRPAVKAIPKSDQAHPKVKAIPKSGQENQAAPAQTVAPGIKTMTFENLRFGLTKTVTELDGKGPDNRDKIDFYDQLDLDAPEDFDVGQIFSLSSVVFPDVNRNANIYYYMPGRHLLSWNREDGYLLRFYYKGEVKPGEPNRIHIEFWLTPTHQSKDVKLLKRLIEIQKGKALKELMRLPADYKLSLQLGASDIGEGQVAISGIDINTGQIHVSLETDVVTLQMLEDQLKDLGWGATLTVHPIALDASGPQIPPQPINVTIGLTDRESFAQKEWGRGPGEFTDFTNEYDFHLQLKRLYFLRDIGDKRLKAFGFNLGDTILVPGQKAKIRNAPIPKDLEDGKLLKAWYDFSLVPDEASLERVLGVLTGGVGDVPVKTLNIVAVNAQEFFDKFNIYQISVQVGSVNFDPSGTREIIKEYKLSRDKFEISGEPLYLPRESTGVPSLFRYRITIIDKNADRFTDKEWRQGEEGEAAIYIGEKHAREILAEKIKIGEEKRPPKKTAEAGEAATAPPGGVAGAEDFVLERIEPESVMEGVPLTLRILGSGFQDGAKVFIEVNVNVGTDQEPKYDFRMFDCVILDPTQIQVVLDMGFSADPAERKIYVANPDGRKTGPIFLKIIKSGS